MRFTTVGDPKFMIRLVFLGTLIVTVALTILLTFSFVFLNNYYVLGRFLIGIGILLYLLIVMWSIKKQRDQIAAWMLVTLYALVAFTILFVWGLNAPVGILTLGFVILLTSVMLGSKFIPVVTVGIIGLLSLVQILHVYSGFEPDRSSLALQSSFGDVFTYGVIFGIFALIAWLSGRQKALSLKRALDAEKALELEKASLAAKLHAQTLSLREAQLEEMKQLYHFAELGQLTTVILHELANYLTILALDIDELPKQSKKTNTIDKVKESVKYLELMVKRVRHRLNSSNEIKRFSAVKSVRDTVNGLKIKAESRGVALNINIHKKTDSSSFLVFGDSLRLSQVITILINNAIDASDPRDLSSSGAKIDVVIVLTRNTMKISVIDYGVGISDTVRKDLFQPLHSTKANGLGMGLYIAQQIVATHFKSTLSLSSRSDATEFIVTLRRSS